MYGIGGEGAIGNKYNNNNRLVSDFFFSRLRYYTMGVNIYRLMPAG